LALRVTVHGTVSGGCRSDWAALTVCGTVRSGCRTVQAAWSCMQRNGVPLAGFPVRARMC